MNRFLPPVLVDAVAAFRGRTVQWAGSYPSWEAARAKCSGYDAAEILAKVVDATRLVEGGKFVCERDSVLFDKAQYSWPLLASLLWIRARTGTLRVVDFGGSLGSTWRQNSRFIQPNELVEWRVVEQPAFVAAGRAEFERDGLAFFSTIAEAAQGGVDVCLFSSSLCYVEDPWSCVEAAEVAGARFLLIDLTPFYDGGDHRICIQTVPPSIYTATYPCWIFARDAFRTRISQNFRLVEAWEHPHHVASGVRHEGGLWERV